MNAWSEIQYRDFWDVPRSFVTHHAGRTYLFEDPFDDATEDYTQHYDVYELPALDTLDLAGSWVGLSNRALRKAGRVRVQDIVFDETKRHWIDTAVFEVLGNPAPRKQAG